MDRNWKTRAEIPFDMNCISALLDNLVPAVRIQSFATGSECDALAATITNMPHHQYGFGKPGAYLGRPLSHYRDRPKDEYFTDVKSANEERSRAIDGVFDPVQRFLEIVSRDTKHEIAIAEEPGHGAYYAGIIRLITGGTDLHVDFAPTFAKDALVVGDIDVQLAWNLYVTEPEEGGETTIYNRPFEFHGREVGYRPIDENTVRGAESYTFKPKKGDVVIFNTMNPHVVHPSSDPAGTKRIATGTFIGRTLDRGNLIIWS